MAKRKDIDWEAIEKQYRLGQKSMRTLADEFGVNVSNISRRVKSEQWVQDKSDEVRQRTKAALVAQRERNTPTREDIEIAVQTNKDVITGHRKIIQDGKRIVEILHGQLKELVSNRNEIEETIEEETVQDPTTKRRNSMLKAISLPSNAGTVRDLSMTLKNLIPLERQAYGIDEDGRRADPIEEISIIAISAGAE